MNEEAGSPAEASRPKPVDAREIMRSEKVYFVHGILKTDSPSGNTLLKPGTDWRTKLNIVVALNPTLACSSLAKDDTVNNMWIKMGVIVNGGDIEAAAAGDNVTQAKTLARRTRRHEELTAPTRDEVVAAVHKQRLEGSDTSIDRSYNEISIAKTDIVGFYVSNDPHYLDTAGVGIYPSHEEIYGWVEEMLHMPVYVYKGNKFFPARYNQDTRHYEPVGESAAEPENIADTPPYKPTPAIAEGIISSLMERPPFVEFTPGLKEMSCARSYNYGREHYMALNAHKILEQYKPTLPDEGKVVVSSYPAGGNNVRWCIYINKGQTWYCCEIESIKTGKIDTKGVEGIFSEGDIKTGLYGQREHIWYQDTRVDNTNSYIEGMSKSLQRYESINDRRDSTEEIRNLVFHMYGYADQAELVGDTESAQLVREFAAQYIPEAEVRDLLTRRQGENGEIKMSAADLAELSSG